MGVFKAYDIRGVYPNELDEQFAYDFGRALVIFLDASTIIVGYDVRHSSPALHKKFIEGVTDQGCNVKDIGLCSTNMLYFAARREHAVMITASHTPKEYNGFKPCRKGAVPIGSESGLKEIEALVAQKKFPDVKKKGRVTTMDILKEFVDDVALYAAGIDRKMKVVVDAGNGAASIAVGEIARKIGIEIVPLFFERDGNFPGRGPNPFLVGATDALAKAVVKNNAEFGVAYDADCDRVFFVDEKGILIQPDFITALIAEQLLKQKPKATILYDLRSSKAVRQRIETLGGNALMTRVGHSFIKATMRETGAIFAGELSGHYYYASNSYADSGDITLVLMLGLVCSSKQKLSALAAPLLTYFASGEINFTVKDKQKVMQRLRERYSTGTQTLADVVAVRQRHRR